MFKIDKYYYKVKKIDFSNETEIENSKKEIAKIQNEVDQYKVDFTKISFFKYNKRVISTYRNNINEEIILNYLKDKINRMCSVHFPDRSTIMQKLFDELPVLSKLQDFTIIRFDFKKYFYSISNEYVIKNVLCNYKFSREDMDYLYLFSGVNKYSCAGLSLSNTFAELLARSFDLEVKTALFEYGINFYARYVDDGIIILDSYIGQDAAIKILQEAIDKVFYKTKCKVENKVKLNMSKTYVINKRTLITEKVAFLGYEFTLKLSSTRDSIDYLYGITDEKIKKYENKIRFLIDKINKEGNLKKMQLALKISCSRVVYCNRKTNTWVSRGIIQNYCMLSKYCDRLDSKTESFLKNTYIDIFNTLGIKIPGYLYSQRYKLIESLKKNKTIIFNSKIGVKDNDLKIMHSTICGPATSEDYDYLVMRILKELRIGY